MRLFRPTWKDEHGERVQGRKWSVQFGHQGKIYKRALHTGDRRIAERKALLIIEEVEREHTTSCSPDHCFPSTGPSVEISVRQESLDGEDS